MDIDEIEQLIFEKMKAKDFGESMCNETKLNVLRWTMKQLHIHNVVQQSELLCQYEPDNTTAMNCKHCGEPKWVHQCCALA